MSTRDARLHRSRDPWVGRLIDERYLIHELVAESGAARVYRARDRLTGARVALKRLSTGDAGARFLVRFRSTAFRVAQLKPPRLVPILDYALIDGDAVLAMDWMTTPTLREHLARRGRLRGDIASQLGLWLADALADLHRQRVLHLGLTPGNIFLDTVVGVRVCDVGLARIMADTGLTLTGTDMGHRLPYLAPEQLASSEVTSAADVYAYGVVLFEALTGELPFHSASVAAQVAAQAGHAYEPPPRPSDLVRGIPVALDDTVALCLQADPRFRPADAMEIAARLRVGTSETSKVALAYVARATFAHRALSRYVPALSIQERRPRRASQGRGRTRSRL
jgi:serine/threonine-protein kinase